MCDELDRPAKVSPLNRLIAAQKELIEAQSATRGKSGSVSGNINGQIQIGSNFYTKETTKKIADDIYFILGEDE